MKKPTGEPLQHPHYGPVTNITPPDASGKRQRVSESGHTVVDVKCTDGERRTLLLSSFVTEPPPAPGVAIPVDQTNVPDDVSGTLNSVPESHTSRGSGQPELIAAQ